MKPPESIPKHVEIWTSTTSLADGFSKIAGARLQHRTAEQVITFPPTPAKYVKVRVPVASWRELDPSR